MSAQTIRTPRGVAATGNRNLCINPSFETDLREWIVLGYGAGGAGVNERAQTNVKNGQWAMQKRWTTASSAGFDTLWKYFMPFWTQGLTRRVYAWVYTTRAQMCAVRTRHFNASAVLIEEQLGDYVAVPAGVWTSIGGSFTAPAGTAGTDVVIGTTADNAQSWQVGDRFVLDAVLITEVDGPQFYFDGASAQNGPQTYGWAGEAHHSESVEFQPDPATIVTPWDTIGYEAGWQSLNTVHQLLSGATMAVVAEAAPRDGVLQMLFDDRDEAWNCVQKHNQVGTWEYSDERLPQTHMTYVVAGRVRAYLSEARATWIVEIPYRELSA